MLLKEFNNAADDHHIIRTLLILKIKHVMSSTERFLSCIGVKQGAKKCQQVSNITVQYVVPCYVDHLA